MCEWGEGGRIGPGERNLWFFPRLPHLAGLIWVRLPAWGSWVRRADEHGAPQEAWVSW